MTAQLSRTELEQLVKKSFAAADSFDPERSFNRAMGGAAQDCPWKSGPKPHFPRSRQPWLTRRVDTFSKKKAGGTASEGARSIIRAYNDNQRRPRPSAHRLIREGLADYYEGLADAESQALASQEVSSTDVWDESPDQPDYSLPSVEEQIEMCYATVPSRHRDWPEIMQAWDEDDQERWDTYRELELCQAAGCTVHGFFEEEELEEQAVALREVVARELNIDLIAWHSRKGRKQKQRRKQDHATGRGRSKRRAKQPATRWHETLTGGKVSSIKEGLADAEGLVAYDRLWEGDLPEPCEDASASSRYDEYDEWSPGLLDDIDEIDDFYPEELDEFDWNWPHDRYDLF